MNHAAISEERKPEIVVSEGDRGQSKHRLRGSSARGRLLLVVIFCVLRGIDILMYFGTPPGDKSRLIAALITGAIWTTVILAGIWFRQNWARYVLIMLVLLNVLGFALFVPDLAETKGLNNPFVHILIISGVVYVGVALCLIRSRHIRRLTHRSSQ